MNYYSIHGFSVHSVMELLPLIPMDSEKVKDVDIHIKKSSQSFEKLYPLETTKTKDFHQKISQQDIVVNLAGIATFQIQNGSSIAIQPHEGAAKQTIQLYLLGSIFAVLLYQRNLLVLHANAIEINGKAVLFTGESGAGKSTTAAIFQQKGYSVISDDVIVINKNCTINGGFPQIKLFQNSLDELNIPNKDLTAIKEQRGKFIVPTNTNNYRNNLDIAAIYTLNLAPESQPDMFEINPVTGLKRFTELIKHTYRNELIGGLETQEQHLNTCSELSKNTYIAKITRPTSHFNGYELADEILLDLKKMSPQTKQ